jgi:hypothetical protein
VVPRVFVLECNGSFYFFEERGEQMKKLTSAEVRQMFLDFFKPKDI